ncbi:MAG: hypothetical protein SRB1_02521 [Desulfobacteraceae bacterium Eth-SRB1]|nr:MAG: hypothetical protein SRB1_02521 [Desulfobacteraceae bacterium Eth-SRB1]
MKNTKPYKIFLIFFILSCFAGLAFLYYEHRASYALKNQNARAAIKHSNYRLRIKGFSLHSVHEDNSAISIKADSFAIEKKKLGFFRFGLINVARFKNAVIDIYGLKKESSDSGKYKSIFKNVFSGDFLPSNVSKRVASVIIEPICVRLRDDKESVITEISAASASLRLKHRDILFKGGVRATSGISVLTTDKLCFNYDNGTVSARHHYVLNEAGKRYEGNKLTTDIFLARLPR